MHYTEEVELLLEEMHQVLAFLKWDVNRWKQCALRMPQRVISADLASSSPENKGPLEEGLRAYALRQASVRQCLFDTFAQHGMTCQLSLRWLIKGLLMTWKSNIW